MFSFFNDPLPKIKESSKKAKSKSKKNKSVKEHTYSSKIKPTHEQNQPRNLPDEFAVTQTLQTADYSHLFQTNAAGEFSQMEAGETEKETGMNKAALSVIIIAVFAVSFVVMLYLCHKFDIFNERDNKWLYMCLRMNKDVDRNYEQSELLSAELAKNSSQKSSRNIN